MPADFYLKRGNTLPPLTGVLKASGAIIDLTDAAEVRLHVWLPSPTNPAPKVDAACTIVTPASGEVSYAWAASDTDTAGLYYYEHRITFVDGSTLTVPNDRPGYLLEITEDGA